MIVSLKFLGRWGNCLFEYAFARGFSESKGAQLHTEPWIGQRIFELDDPPYVPGLPRLDEGKNESHTGDCEVYSYAQNQACASFYSRDLVKKWFKIRPEIRKLLTPPAEPVVCHLRRGDYKNSGYPIVSQISYLDAIRARDIKGEVKWVSDDYPSVNSGLPPEMGFLQDFFYMMKAEVLFRANSSFSFWAAELSNARVFSPIIDGLEGGKLHDGVGFIEGNWPRLANLPFITDIHL